MHSLLFPMAISWEVSAIVMPEQGPCQGDRQRAASCNLWIKKMQMSSMFMKDAYNRFLCLLVLKSCIFLFFVNQRYLVANLTKIYNLEDYRQTFIYH